MPQPSTEQTPESQTRGHHPDSPSSLQASEACAKFENEQRESEASRVGTLCHLAVETRDLSILENEEQALSAQRAIDYEDRIIAYFKSQKVDPIISREKYMPVGDDIVIDKDGRRWTGITGGFPDNVIYSLTLGEAHVPDWKFGKIPVTPTKDNVQGISYALAAFQLLGPRIKTVTVHFFHPNQGWSDEEQERLYIHTFSRDDIPAMELRVRTIIARKKDPKSKPTPKVDVCLWCAKKGSCEANTSIVLQIADKYPEFTVPAIVDPLQLRLPSQWAQVLEFADQFTSWAKAAKQRACDMVVTEGYTIPDWIVRKRVDRTVESLKLFKSAALKNGVTEDEFFDALTVSITQVSDLVKSKAPKGQGAAAVRQFDSDLQELGATGLAKPVFFLQKAKTPADKEKQLQ